MSIQHDSYKFTSELFKYFAYAYGDKWLNRFDKSKEIHLCPKECFELWREKIQLYLSRLEKKEENSLNLEVLKYIFEYSFPDAPPTLYQFLYFIKN